MKQLTRVFVLTAATVGAAAFLAYQGGAQQAKDQSPTVTVYKSPT